MTFLNILGLAKNIMQFQINSKTETGKKISESSRSEFLEKFSANNFALTDAEDRCRRQHLSAVEKSRYIRFTFIENTTGNTP